MTTTHMPLTLAPGDDLAQAIASASAGAVIRLGPGRHRAADLTIRRPLALVGAGDATLIISQLWLEAEGLVVLRDLAIEGAVQVGGATQAELRDCHIQGAAFAGMTLTDAADAVVHACFVERCQGPGLLIGGHATAIVEGCILLENVDAGIAWEGDAGGEAHGNLCEANGLGIRVAGRAAPLLMHNTLRRNAGVGIHYRDAAGGRVAGTFCDRNRGQDIVVAVTRGAGPLLGQNRAFVTRS